MKATVLRDWIDRELAAGGEFEILLPDDTPMRYIRMLGPSKLPDVEPMPPLKRKAPQGKKSRAPKRNHPWKMMPVGRQMPFMDRIDERRAEENYLMGPEEAR